MKQGVNVYGYVFAESGMGELTRSLIAALREGEVDFAVIPTTETESRQQSGFSDLGTGTPDFDINIVGVNADSMPFFVDRFGYSALEGRYTICIWAWEVEQFPEWMAQSADLVDEVWGISAFTAESISRKVSKPVSVFPLPVRQFGDHGLTRADLGLPDGFMFLFGFDFDSVFQRKNPVAVVEAFKQAFSEAEEVRLVIKSANGHRHDAQLDELRRSAAGREDILIVDAYLDPAKQQALMRLCDSYVSLHRSEGFGLTMAEAMAVGKPVIATGYSGNLDFMNERNSFPVPFDFVEVGENCYPYPAESRWAEPNIGVAARYMRQVFEGSKEVRDRAERGRRTISDVHSPASRSRFVVDRLARARRELERRHSIQLTCEKEASVARHPIDERAEEHGNLAAEVAAIEAMIRRGPDVASSSALPVVVPWLRRTMMRLNRNYVMFQQEVNLEMLALLGVLDARIDQASPSGPVPGSGDLARQLATAAEIADDTARECEETFGVPSANVARKLRLLAARLRGFAH